VSGKPAWCGTARVYIMAVLRIATGALARPKADAPPAVEALDVGYQARPAPSPLTSRGLAMHDHT